MGFLKQTWTLTVKNLLIVCVRHWGTTLTRAFIAPIIFMFFISYAKNFFVPPSDFGIGYATPVRSLENALRAASGGRDTVVLVNNGFTGGHIENVINQLSGTVRAAGKNIVVASSDTDLFTTCRSSLRGVTACYGAASFHSSPTEGPGGQWNYTLMADGSLGEKIFVNRNDNDAEIFVLPFQHAIDSTIATLSGTTLPTTVEEKQYTSENQEERGRNITRLYQGTLINILAVAFFIGMVGVTYQLVGQMAQERELGISQLIEAMMPNARRWEPQAARLLSNHLAFDILYLPSWIIMGLLVAYLVFPDTSVGMVVGFHILTGFALCSYSLLFGSFFHKAQLSGIVTTIISLVLAIIAQVAIGAKGKVGAVVVLSILFPPMNYTFFIIWLARWQRLAEAADLLRVPPYSVYHGWWQVSGIVFFIFFIIQIFTFPVLGAIVERSLYGTASRTRKTKTDSDRAAVTLKHFSKHYRPGWFTRNILSCGLRKSRNTVIAVNDLSLEVLKGQIMILLGANGSGKSTTLDAIAGLNTVTGGSIELDGTGGLGLCPQKNVLWDDLIVYEHVMIFNRLKATGSKATKAETCELVAACDLKTKLQAKSSTLSGGQKRKLQLAMMFTGGSRVCCVDEVSSGIDPLARRKVWDILLAERGRRSILLTTHFLDEADVLSDHIAILSKGVLKAEGTAVELKHKFGGGYKIFVDNDVAYIPGIDLEKVPKFIDYDQTVYQLASSAEVSRFIKSLDEGGTTNYRVQGPTVEDVFLSLADEIKENFIAANAPTSRSATPSDQLSEDQSTSEVRLKDRPLELLPGRGTGLLRQSWVLFRKRWTVLRRNYLPYCAAVLIPVIAAGLVTKYLQDFAPLGCAPGDQIRTSQLQQLANLQQPNITYGPPSAEITQILEAGYSAFNASTLHTVNTLSDFNSYIDVNYANVTPGGFFFPPNGGNPVFAYAAQFDLTNAVLVQNFVDSLLIRQPIATSYQDFAIPFAPKAGSTLQLILYFGLAMCAYPGFFALYPTAERIRKVRALHYSNGVRSAPLWSAYVLFDFFFVFLISLLAVILFVSQWYGFYGPGTLFVVFFLYGLTSIVYSYVISLFVTSPLAAYAFSAGSQAVLFLLYFISYLSIITYAPANKIDHYITVAHFTIGLVTPSGNLLRALLLTLNEFSILCKGTSVASYPGDIVVYGGPILYLTAQFFLLLLFLIWWDSGGRLGFSKKSKNRIIDPEKEPEYQNPDIAEDVSYVAVENDGLRVLNLTKAFGHNVAVDDVTFGIKKGEVFALLGPNGAGKSTTISLVRGDLRRTITRKGGDIFVEGIALSEHRAAARNHLGVCPQFDAMDSMTVLEHLRFYARVRGVPDVEHNVTEVMRAVGLEPYKRRMAAKLSGGNKRKLSLAIALMGNPSVLLLDEPSSGMDAAAKRVMWRVLASVTAGRALLITTHSMEEADALAERAGIMARKMLALGTTEALRKRHGDAYYVHMVHREAPHTSTDEMDRVKAWVTANVEGAIVEGRTYHGQLRFSVPNMPSAEYPTTEQNSAMVKQRQMTSNRASGIATPTDVISSDAMPPRSKRLGISALFDLLESNKEELGFAYYSVSPTTLDQVFLNVVNKHNIEEENYASHRKVEKKPFLAWMTRK